MMKKVFTILSFVLVGLNAVAQSDTAEVKKAAVKICDCLNKEPKGSLKTQAQLQTAVQKCFVSDALTEVMELATKRNIQMNDRKGMEKIGLDISMELMRINCSAFIDFALLSGQEEMAKKNKGNIVKDDEVKPEDEITMANTVEGKVTKVESIGGHIKLTVLATNKKSTTVTWLRYFAGSEKYTANPKMLVGKTVNISYADFEVIDPVTKSYINLKEIKTLQVN